MRDRIAQYLAVEFSPLRVNAVSPGLTDTYGMCEATREAVAESALVERPGEPEEIAAGDLVRADESERDRDRPPRTDGGSTLLRAATASDALSDLDEVAHVFHAAYPPRDDLRSEAETNREMLSNLLDGLSMDALERAVRYQGVKY